MNFTQSAKMQCEYCSAWGDVELDFETDPCSKRSGHKVRLHAIAKIPEAWSLHRQLYSSDPHLCCPSCLPSRSSAACDLSKGPAGV